MFESIKKIFSKTSEKAPRSAISLEDLPAWLDEKEAGCISRRNAASTSSRERLLKLEQDLHQLLTEFGEESSDEPHHHKVEQVNRHALPQFCKKIEAELEGEFSEDDEVFYREVAGLINGCFKAYRGPGRYLHHLYPDEVKVFKQTLDYMGHELNRMTEIIRISRERLMHIAEMRALLHNRDALIEEEAQAGAEEKKCEARLYELKTDIQKAGSELERLLASDSYASYLRLEEETGQIWEQLEKARETWESQIRVALPVWKRGVKAFQEQAKPVDEKNMEDLIQAASSPRRDDDEIARLISLTAKPLFTLFESGIVQAKNSFEKHLFTNAEEYTKKFGEISICLHTLSEDLKRKKQDLEGNVLLEQKNHITQTITEAEKRIDELNQEEEKRKERLSSLKEKQRSILEELRKKFSEFTEEEMDLMLPGEES